MLGWWIGGVAFVLSACTVVVFNDLVAARNQVRGAWSDIDVQLTRRHDLVPQLVAAVRGYAGYERATLTTLTELRSRAVAAASVPARAIAEGDLGVLIERILALQERNPDLKASGHFLALQRDLVDVEDHLQAARRFYNGSVRDFNDRIETFPSVLVARATHFSPADFFRQGDGQEGPA